MLKPCPFHTLFTLCKLKKLLCPSKKPAGTPYQYDQIHICFCLWPFLDPSTYIIATIVFLRYWRHWPSFSFIAIWYQMILQVVNTSSQWVENISEGAFLFFKRMVEYLIFKKSCLKPNYMLYFLNGGIIRQTDSESSFLTPCPPIGPKWFWIV